MKQVDLRVVLVLLFTLFTAVACNNQPKPEVEARKALDNFMQAIEEGDLEFNRKYACHEIRDMCITPFVKMCGFAKPMAVESEMMGQKDFSTFMTEATAPVQRKMLLQFKPLLNYAIDDNIISYPGHEDVCKIFTIRENDDNTTDLNIFVHKVDDKWLVSTMLLVSAIKKEPKYDEDLYEGKVFPKKAYNDKYYDLNNKITWEFVLNDLESSQY